MNQDKSATSHYTFGDTDLAARRLLLLSRVFDGPSREFLKQWGSLRPSLAMDLGCGPGATTALLHALSEAKATVGVELSEKHLARAIATAPPGVSFEQHDLRETPYVFGPAPLIFTRFLLTHLAEPGALLRAAAQRLTASGRLLVQETARMDADHPTLRRYYELVHEMQRRLGQSMYIGRDLGGLAEAALSASDAPNARVLFAGERAFEVEAKSMAELHLLNLRTWRSDPVAQQAFAADELDRLDVELSAILRGELEAAPVRLALGELVIERA